MTLTSGWKEDWTLPPKNEEELQQWIYYLCIWSEAQLTAPGYYVHRWLKMGYFKYVPDDEEWGFARLAIEKYCYPPPTRRHQS